VRRTRPRATLRSCASTASLQPWSQGTDAPPHGAARRLCAMPQPASYSRRRQAFLVGALGCVAWRQATVCVWGPAPHWARLCTTILPRLMMRRARVGVWFNRGFCSVSAGAGTAPSGIFCRLRRFCVCACVRVLCVF
jgi:hypothetical protein